MCSRPQFTELTYMGGTGPCGPMTIIFGSAIQSQHTSLNIKFGVNRMFHVLKTTVYRFDLYGRYQTLWTMTIIFGSIIQSQHTSLNIKFGVNRTLQLTDDDNFGQCSLELVYKPKYQIWCESDVPCAQDPSYRIDLYGRYLILWTDDDNFWQYY